MFENVIADILSLGGVKGVYIADLEGNLIESESSLGDDEVHAALMVEMFNKSSELAVKISGDSVESIVVEGSKDRIVVTRAGDVILGVVADSKVNYGLLKIEIRKAVEKIAAMT